MFGKRFSRLKKESMLVDIAYNMGISYSAPSGLSYMWNFGSLALLSLVVQIFTGVMLALFYTGHADLAFDSVEHSWYELHSVILTAPSALKLTHMTADNRQARRFNWLIE